MAPGLSHRFAYPPPALFSLHLSHVHPFDSSIRQNPLLRIVFPSLPLLHPSLPPLPSPRYLTNPQVLSQIRSLTASLFGVAAGILGLESVRGFLFYLFGTVLVSELVISLLAAGKPERYFESVWTGLWAKDVVAGLSSFVLTWTLFYGLVRS